MLPTQSNILVFCIPKQYPYFAFKFLRLTCNIRVFQCNFDTRYVCCCAECDMPVTRSKYSSLDIELHARVTWPWDGRRLYNVCGLKLLAHGVPVIPYVPGDTVMVDSGSSRKASANNAKAMLCPVAEQLLMLANRGELYCCWFLAAVCISYMSLLLHIARLGSNFCSYFICPYLSDLTWLSNSHHSSSAVLISLFSSEWLLINIWPIW